MPVPATSAPEPTDPASSEPADPEPTDADLVRGARDGDPRAWEGIVDRHLPLVNAIARSYRLSAPDREDAVQTVWLTLNQHLPRLRSPDRLRAWLRRVTNDACARQRRHGARQSPVAPDVLTRLPFPDCPDLESQYLERERHDELHRAIRHLPPRDRIVALSLLDDTPHDPNTPGGSRVDANQRRRVRRRLRRILEDPH
ncbi:RNA polymerase sigma factor [Nocardiopsis sp. FIRDI 009]|uniref:RNA polymerase sigma factor n=1 Tax=Nocardiopsis sp. FIRDI 009 TaxID=714197 RepID=UPI000E26144F|nr:sigma-70 family RNA polymerase sigma factor [Nocardiopsis sp. FIRDI 009]